MLKRLLRNFKSGLKSTNRIKANKMSKKEPLNMKQKGIEGIAIMECTGLDAGTVAEL